MTRLIDADEVLNRIDKIFSLPWGDEDGNRVELELDKATVIRLIEKSPTVDPYKHGEWIERWERRGDKEVHVIGERECSVCHAKMLLTYPNYCPSCGAKMGSD